MNKTWEHSLYYEESSEVQKKLLDILDDILSEVQYAPVGSRNRMRREAAELIVSSLTIHMRSK